MLQDGPRNKASVVTLLSTGLKFGELRPTGPKPSRLAIHVSLRGRYGAQHVVHCFALRLIEAKPSDKGWHM